MDLLGYRRAETRRALDPRHRRPHIRVSRRRPRRGLRVVEESPRSALRRRTRRPRRAAGLAHRGEAPHPACECGRRARIWSRPHRLRQRPARRFAHLADFGYRKHQQFRPVRSDHRHVRKGPARLRRPQAIQLSLEGSFERSQIHDLWFKINQQNRRIQIP